MQRFSTASHKTLTRLNEDCELNSRSNKAWKHGSSMIAATN